MNGIDKYDYIWKRHKGVQATNWERSRGMATIWEETHMVPLI